MEEYEVNIGECEMEQREESQLFKLLFQRIYVLHEPKWIPFLSLSSSHSSAPQSCTFRHFSLEEIESLNPFFPGANIFTVFIAL